MRSDSLTRQPLSPGEAQGAEYRVRPTVLSARVLDGVILLDLSSESYMTLNDVSADIWEHLAEGSGRTAIVEWLCARYDASSEQVNRDVTCQLGEFLRLGLIVPSTASPAPASDRLRHQSDVCLQQRQGHERVGLVRLPSYGQCLAAFLTIKVRLWLSGYGGTLSWLSREAEVAKPSECIDLATARAAEYRVAMVGALYPGRARCLEQSLSLYALLRRMGVAVKYRHGVKRYPFQAHVWIEYQGQVINDVPEHIEQFAILPDQLP